MKIEIQGSASAPYVVDTDAITCTCPHFKHRCSRYSATSTDRFCKHIQQVFNDHPELAPAWYQMKTKAIESEVSPEVSTDGKIRYPIAFFDEYVFDIKSVMKTFGQDIKKYEFCGSYRRRNKMVSDLDVLIVLEEGHSPDAMLNYCEEMLGYDKLWRGDKKASYKIDGLVQVDFKFVPLESWPFAVLHYTGSKNSNIALRQRANNMGLSLNEYGITNKSTGAPVDSKFESEVDIYNYLGVPYKEPWDRN